mmetsp:Transcript_70684/g.187872  ORF Transcript_70684/g.187872 Transcript_70684/m.187872 type:complete len:335 (-) Transcript_70684:193-1197(-)
MGCWRGVLAADCFAALRPQEVRFKDSVQEFRYEPSSGLLPSISIRQCTRLLLERSRSWRASQTLDGRRYFYHPTKREYCWELPKDASNQAWHDLSVGDEVEVFCHSEKSWCSGYVERCTEAVVGVVFQTPGASFSNWIKKELPPGHPDIRRCGSAPLPSTASSSTASPEPPAAVVAAAPLDAPSDAWGAGAIGGFVETSLPANWTAAEEEAYDHLFARAANEVSSGLVMQTFADYFDPTGFQQKSLDSIWQVANPDLKESLGIEEFRALCRLVAHCQALVDADASSGAAGALRKGGGRLRSLLRERCLASPPPSLPRLSPTLSVPGGAGIQGTS